MSTTSSLTVESFLNLLARIERLRRACRVTAECSARIPDLLEAAEAIAREREAVQDAERNRAFAQEQGIPAEEITPEAVVAWGAAHLDGTYNREHAGSLWEWDDERDLPVAVVEMLDGGDTL